LHFIDYLDVLDEATDNAVLDEEQRRWIAERLPVSEAQVAPRLDLMSAYMTLLGARCLDVGAGVGQYLVALEAQGAKPEGIEVSALRRQFALEKFGLKLHARPVESPCWQTRSGDFDMLTFWDVIEHVNDPLATVRSAWRLLRPGGLLALETPSREVLSYTLSQRCYRLTRGRLSLFLRNFYDLAPFGHKQIFTRSQLVSLLSGNGFRILYAHTVYPSDAGGRFLRPQDKIILVAEKVAAQAMGT
ncbi:MAG: class I SAM-dependent methyltransferase, partial [Alphaproteobacteria bacterium]|nr:class I SAM-dependent methyltransferase [Alphaproteobacteria bacterium]